MFTYELQAPGTDIDIELGYYVYIRRDADFLYWDAIEEDFVVFENLTAGKLPLTEDENQPGLWRAELSLESVTGGVSVIPRSALTDISAGRVSRFYLFEGELLVNTTRPYVLLHTHYGGIDALRLVAEDGAPVSGANIRVFRKDSYEAVSDPVPLGVSSTGKGGRWTSAIPVAPSTTYIVQFTVPKLYGPDDVEVVVS